MVHSYGSNRNGLDWMNDNSWLSDRTKTVIVVIIMTALVVGMGWGYYSAHRWQEDRKAIKASTEQIEYILKNKTVPMPPW